MMRIVAAIVTLLTLGIFALLLQNTRLTHQAAIAEREAAELRTAIERAERAQRADQSMMEAQFKTIEAFDKKIKELKAYVAALPDRDSECLSPADTDRLRSLWAD